MCTRSSSAVFFWLNSILSVFALVPCAYAAPSIAVLELQGHGISQTLSQTCSDLARASVIQTVGHSAVVLTPENQSAILNDSTDLLESTCTEDACDVALLRILDVDFGISSRVNRMSNRYFGSMTLYETATGRALFAEKIRASTESELIAVVEQRALLLARRIPGITQQRAREEVSESSLGVRGKRAHDSISDVIVTLQSEPPGAMVLLDEEPICSHTPCEKRLPVGVYEFRFVLDQHRAVSRIAEVSGGMAPVMGLLKPIFATVAVSISEPVSHLEIDGKSHVWSKAQKTIRLSSGAHEIWIADPCFEKTGERIFLKEGEHRLLRLEASFRMASVSLHIIDKDENDVEAPVLLRGDALGLNTETLQVPLCTSQLSIKLPNDTIQVDLPTLSTEKLTTVRTLIAADTSMSQTGWGKLRRKQDRKSQLTWVRIPSGVFHYGCERHDDACETVEKSGGARKLKEFWFLETEVSVAAYRQCVDAGVCRGRSCNRISTYPANCMNLQHAKKFCAWLGGRVPTPEEWEYVAKSGASRIFPWANGTPTATLASFQRKEHPDGSGPIGSHPTGNTPWGIKDMAGSIAEWTQEQPTGQAQLRGGSWQSRMPMFLRTSYRQLESDDFQDATTGIRCVQ